MAECVFEDRLVRDLEKAGWFVRRIAYRGKRTATDLLVGYDGYVAFVELKDRGEIPRPDQAKEHKKMRKHGLQVFVFDNYHDAWTTLNAVAAAWDRTT